MKRKIKALVVLSGVVVVAAMLGFSTLDQDGEWVVPPAYKKLKNPLADDTKATAKGKKIYVKICSTCHGNLGKGDGPAGKELNPRPADHSGSKVQAQPDGILYYKITKGRNAMPAYATLLSKTERWQVINYIRTLSDQ